jgi:hypothetical protein
MNVAAASAKRIASKMRIHAGRVSSLSSTIFSISCAWNSMPGMRSPRGVVFWSSSASAVAPTSTMTPFSRASASGLPSTMSAAAT